MHHKIRAVFLDKRIHHYAVREIGGNPGVCATYSTFMRSENDVHLRQSRGERNPEITAYEAAASGDEGAAEHWRGPAPDTGTRPG
jgi:hypothetical protein